jgi:translocator protein
LLDILLLLAAILATMAAFFRVNRMAGLLLAPYLAWVAFATILNFTLWWMNRG